MTFKWEKDFNRHFSKKHIQRACAKILPIIREVEIKTTVRYHFTPTRMATSKRQTITSVHKYMEILEPLCIAVGM